jgi:hypothetical protein
MTMGGGGFGNVKWWEENITVEGQVLVESWKGKMVGGELWKVLYKW